jgi:L-ascorbate metabolism protein UlaG (beta-lactamase superfamily)
MVTVTFHGHSCFEFEGDAGKVIVDPFLTGNPQADCGPDDIEVDAVLLTHFHNDHGTDAIDIAKRLDVPIIGTFETVEYCKSKGADGHAMHIGGTYRFDFGTVRLTTATHSNASPDGIALGLACGFVIDFEPTVVYYAGDTGVTLDMKLLDGIIETVDVACLPIGGNFTMNIGDAVIATEFVNPRFVIPFHYNTWPVIEADPNTFAKMVACDCTVMDPGESEEFE